MFLLSLIIHLLSDLSKDAHGVEYEGERSGTSALGRESVGSVCELDKHISGGEGTKVPKALE